MKIYLLSLGVGLAVGILYALLHVRSPAPPVVALVGLLGILVGEQLPPVLRHVFTAAPASTGWYRQIKPHMFGQLPSGHVDPKESP
jgi:XapX domain-containing protein